MIEYGYQAMMKSPDTERSWLISRADRRCNSENDIFSVQKDAKILPIRVEHRPSE